MATSSTLLPNETALNKQPSTQPSQIHSAEWFQGHELLELAVKSITTKKGHNLITKEEYTSKQAIIDQNINAALAHPELSESCKSHLTKLKNKISDTKYRLWTEEKNVQGKIIFWNKDEDYTELNKLIKNYKGNKRATLESKTHKSNTPPTYAFEFPVTKPKQEIFSRMKQGFNNFTNNHPDLWRLIKWVVIPAAISAAIVFSGGFAAIAGATLTMGMQWAAFGLFTAAFSFLINGINHLHTSTRRTTVSDKGNSSSSNLAQEDDELAKQKRLQKGLAEESQQKRAEQQEEKEHSSKAISTTAKIGEQIPLRTDSTSGEPPVQNASQSNNGSQQKSSKPEIPPSDVEQLGEKLYDSSNTPPSPK